MKGPARAAGRASGAGRQPTTARTRTGDESWFGALGVDADPHWWDDTRASEEESRYDAGLAEGSAADSKFLTRQARRIIGSGQTAFQRLYSAFIAARAALGFVLLTTASLAGLFGVPTSWPVFGVSAVYAVITSLMWLLPRFRRPAVPKALSRLRSPQWLATIGVDVVCFSSLHVLSQASSLNYAALLVLPVLMAGVLTPRLMALGTAALVTLGMLLNAFLGVLTGGEIALLATQAGLAGAGFFVIALLAGELAGRLAREELTARGSLELARQQAQLNRLVIEEMQDGVLVVDRRLRVRAANPAARALLAPEGMCREAPFQLSEAPVWAGLVTAVQHALAGVRSPEEGSDIQLDFESVPARTLRVRLRFTRRRDPNASEELCVLFLEDVRNMRARSRQEKLAAMGRISAGIAHEIRNPLAAISQANALMAEDATTTSQRQLTRMVTDNVERLKRIVDDVMEVATGDVPAPGPLDATVLVAAVCSEWIRTNDLSPGPQCVVRVDLPEEPIGVAFDREHLRRVLINLLDNGYRHAPKTPGAVHLSLAVVNESYATLSVASGGDPIPAEVEGFLFEPFYSTRSRGTGLGLYICRELCERYGARIEYRLRGAAETNRNEFSVAMRRQLLSASEAAEARLHLTP